MEKLWQNCTASHLRGKHGRANQTAPLTMWWRKIQGGGFRRGVIHAEAQAHICKLQAWAAWLTGCSEANTWNEMPGEAVTVKGERRDKNDLGKDQESFIKVFLGFFSPRKTTFVESLGRNPKLFSSISPVLNLGRRVLRLLRLCCTQLCSFTAAGPLPQTEESEEPCRPTSAGLNLEKIPNYTLNSGIFQHEPITPWKFESHWQEPKWDIKPCYSIIRGFKGYSLNQAFLVQWTNHLPSCKKFFH